MLPRPALLLFAEGWTREEDGVRGARVACCPEAVAQQGTSAPVVLLFADSCAVGGALLIVLPQARIRQPDIAVQASAGGINLRSACEVRQRARVVPAVQLAHPVKIPPLVPEKIGQPRQP